MATVDTVVELVTQVAADQDGLYQESFAFAFFLASFASIEAFRAKLVEKFGESGGIFEMLEYVTRKARVKEEDYWMWQEAH